MKNNKKLLSSGHRAVIYRAVGKSRSQKGLVLFNPVTGLLIGEALGAVLPANLSGIALGMRNLGEALMYIVPFVYWGKKL